MNTLNHGFEYQRRLGSEAAGLQVIEYLTLCYAAFTREEWLARVNAGRVLLDGIPVQEHEILRPGQLLSWIRPPWKEPAVPRSFAILYQDKCLLAVAKPSGLPTLPGGGCFMENTLLSLVRRHFPGASPVHRLGRGTSGIVLFALTQTAATKIFQAWRSGEILKVYRALAVGCPDKDDFAINTSIGPVPHRILKTIHAACSEGKPAHSQIKVLERRASSSLLQVKISTGRPHQIRIHLAAAGYPLVGDPLYIVGGIPADDSRALPSDLGYYLHNALLGFPHPASGKWTEITCGPPPLLRIHCKGDGARDIDPIPELARTTEDA
jgi:23S rRNA pseudouridine1911/1915/1917 synthase